jgi:hypothetical protein
LRETSTPGFAATGTGLAERDLTAAFEDGHRLTVEILCAWLRNLMSAESQQKQPGVSSPHTGLLRFYSRQIEAAARYRQVAVCPGAPFCRLTK